MTRARKRFGQHFLHDPGVIARIIQAIHPQPNDRLVEIGPGRGAMTAPLLERLNHLDVVELDHDLVTRLRDRFPDPERLTIHSADALKFDFHHLTDQPHCLRVVGNLPYNISTPLLFHLLDTIDLIQDMVFMLQKEVVDRIVATPGSRTYGRLSVMVQWQCATERLFNLGPGAFRPPPRVDSAVIHLIPHAQPPVELRNPHNFQKLVADAFAQRRKTLRNALRNWLDAEAIAACGVDPVARAETLDLAAFAALANKAEDNASADSNR